MLCVGSCALDTGGGVSEVAVYAHEFVVIVSGESFESAAEIGIGANATVNLNQDAHVFVCGYVHVERAGTGVSFAEGFE